MLAAAMVIAMSARPILVGHRGSGTGLENSVESFTYGAQRGYDYLETDFKLTKDKQFVCSHDDNTTRLGGTLELATSTLAELQSETLTQTRSGVTYTGRLCSGQEYLDVCKQYNCLPLIELKWTTGINSNDQSNIPLLIKFIEDNGFRNKCIILTSMKPCLEYIRKNYPDITIQFLTGQYWANHFDWCVELGIDVDIQKGYFDKATVDKFHDAGLKVNMWTTNDKTEYKKFGDWGCDFITTDNLDPNDLPELDPLSSVTPNKVDYPEIAATNRGWYLPTITQTATWNSEIAQSEVVDVVYNVSDNTWVILGANGNTIYTVDARSGQLDRSVTTPEALSSIAVTIDNRLLGISQKGTTLYAYTGGTTPTVIYSDSETATYDGCHRLAVSGKLADRWYAYITTAASADQPLSLMVIDGQGGNGQLFATIPFGSGVTAKELDNYRLTVTPTARENFIVETTSKGAPITEYRIERLGTPRVNVFATNTAEICSLAGWSFARRGKKVYAMQPVGTEKYGAIVVDMSSGFAATSDVTDPIETSLPCNTAAIARTAMSNDNTLQFIVVGEGCATATFDTSKPAEDPAPDSDVRIERLWINSVSTSNAPDHIDGTNAKQGTGIGERIYVNDCADKLVYVFDKTGCIGSMPGGAGWGIARDDAGNIIIRDDKLTGTSHSYIIYPAGVDFANPGEPVRFDAEMPLDGQTDFINASGDVLGELGYLYLFSKNQTAVNIMRMKNGKVMSATKSGDITMTATAAGYVVPIDNNAENWLYNVRSVGIAEYNGGETTNVATDRASTTAPARNATGGCARFVIRGNVLLAHNSGKNYVGGFTLRNLTTSTVIGSFDPIGDKGYSTGGNYSTFNWLIAEPIDESSFYLYQYCPANGMALYRVWDNNAGVQNITIDDPKSYTLDIDGDTLTVNGAGSADNLAIYTTTGVLATSVTGNTADIATLAPGVYIVSINGCRANLKFIKR